MTRPAMISRRETQNDAGQAEEAATTFQKAVEFLDESWSNNIVESAQSSKLVIQLGEELAPP
jgi:hypothetical protein